MEQKLKNLTYIVLIGFLVNIFLTAGLYFKTFNTSNNEGNSNNDSTKTYDVSKMTKVNVDGAKALFDSKEIQVLYIGRSDCSVCIDTVPVLNEVQKELNYVTNYLDLNSVSNWKTELKPLADLMTVKTKLTTTVRNEEGESEKVTLDDTMGNIFIKYGFTPTIVIIKDGKMVDGFIGYKDHDTVKKLVEKYM